MFEGIGKISLTQKICLAGLFTALATILQKVIAINYLAALPFFRISFGAPAIIVFSSIFLGPLWGAAVGAFSDILGYFVFDASSYGYMPLITLIYLLLGFGSYFIYKVVQKLGDDKKTFIIEMIVLLSTFVGFSCYIIFGHNCSIWEKIFIPLGLFVLITMLFVFQKIICSKQDKYRGSIKISFTYFLADCLVLVFFGSLMKTIAFSSGPDGFWSLYKTILITQSLVMIFNVVFNTMLLTLFFNITEKYTR